jgi:hypothetical protein
MCVPFVYASLTMSPDCEYLPTNRTHRSRVAGCKPLRELTCEEGSVREHRAFSRTRATDDIVPVGCSLSESFVVRLHHFVAIRARFVVTKTVTIADNGAVDLRIRF